MIITLFLTYINKFVSKCNKVELAYSLISMNFSTAILRTLISSLAPSY